MKKFARFFSLCLTLCMLATLVTSFGISTVSAANAGLPKYVNNDGNKITTVSATSQDIWSKLNQTVVEGRPLFEQGGYFRGAPKWRGDAICIDDHWLPSNGLALYQTPMLDNKDNPKLADGLKTRAANEGPDYIIGDGYVYNNKANNTLGTRFNVPYTGKIKVTFQVSNGPETMANGTPDGGVVAPEATKQTQGFITIGKGDMSLTWACPVDNLTEQGGNYGVIQNVDYRSTSVADFLTQRTVTIDVTAGESVYFMVNSGDGEKLGTTYFYINSVEYTEMSFAPSYSATVIGHNIAALENPVVRFYVQYSEKPSGDFATIKIGNGEETIVFGTPAVGITGPDGEMLTEADNVQIYSIPVAAKRMTETITISIKNDSGSELLTTNNTYSVSEYCTYMVTQYKNAGTAATPEQLALAKICTQILAYGKSAQKYFNYNLDNLPVIDNGIYDLVVADIRS